MDTVTLAYWPAGTSAAVGMAQLADRGQIGGDDIEPPLRPGGAVQRRPREPARRTGAAQLGQAAAGAGARREYAHPTSPA
jgi:hypothetical protein